MRSAAAFTAIAVAFLVGYVCGLARERGRHVAELRRLIASSFVQRAASDLSARLGRTTQNGEAGARRERGGVG